MEIEKNVPLPAPRRANNKYPFGDMEIGDSFTIAIDERGAHTIRSLIAMAWRPWKAKGRRFTTRIEGDVIRCWRIE